jgi:hypothetical protein
MTALSASSATVVAVLGGQRKTAWFRAVEISMEIDSLTLDAPADAIMFRLGR